MERVDKVNGTSSLPTSDSKTMVHLTLHGDRTTMSVRVLPEI